MSHVRLIIKRSGGGVGKVSVTYNVQHITTNDSDITPTAWYTVSQEIIFHHGEVQKSFLITINDDRIKENNENFSLFLSNPSKVTYLGNQYRTVVTIIDDDEEKSCSSFTQISSTDGYGHLRAIAGFPSEFTIHSRSCINKTISVGGDYFITTLTEVVGKKKENSPNILHKGSIEDLGNGDYLCTMNTTKAGKYNLNIYQLIPGGIKGYYFNDRFLSQSSLEKTKVDPAFNFTWGYGRITNYGSDFVSIRWVGFLKAIFSEVYTFYANFDDNVRIWIDGFILIDTWSRKEMDVAQYELNSSFYYHLLIEFREDKGNAMAKLFWSSKQTPYEIIPRSSLFYMVRILSFIKTFLLIFIMSLFSNIYLYS